MTGGSQPVHVATGRVGEIAARLVRDGGRGARCDSQTACARGSRASATNLADRQEQLQGRRRSATS